MATHHRKTVSVHPLPLKMVKVSGTRSIRCGWPIHPAVACRFMMILNHSGLRITPWYHQCIS